MDALATAVAAEVAPQPKTLMEKMKASRGGGLFAAVIRGSLSQMGATAMIAVGAIAQ